MSTSSAGGGHLNENDHQPIQFGGAPFLGTAMCFFTHKPWNSNRKKACDIPTKLDIGIDNSGWITTSLQGGWNDGLCTRGFWGSILINGQKPLQVGWYICWFIPIWSDKSCDMLIYHDLSQYPTISHLQVDKTLVACIYRTVSVFFWRRTGEEMESQRHLPQVCNISVYPLVI